MILLKKHLKELVVKSALEQDINLRSARRSLNIMFQEWANRGVHLWKVKLAKVPLVEGQAEYNFAAGSRKFSEDLDTVLEAYYRNNSDATAPQDIALTKIDRSTYSQTPNKLAKGTPSQYYVERKLNPSIFFYTYSKFKCIKYNNTK